MTQSATKEPDGNVVLRSDNFTIRCFCEWGGSAREFWSEPNPGPLTNSFPGSGVSFAWETGQDPTQASCDGLTKNPIARTGHAPSLKYNYYARESFFDAGGIYEVSGFFPFFWLSHEEVDDAVVAGPGEPTGWRTRYQPGKFTVWNTPNSAVIFEGSKAHSVGYFLVGNEKISTAIPWHDRCSVFPEGRMAAKVTVSLQYAGDGASAGITFRKTPEPVSYAAAFTNNSGMDFVATKDGKWRLFYRTQKLAGGDLTKEEKKLLAGAGLELEIRTNNAAPNYCGLLINNREVLHTDLPAYTQGEAAGLCAACTSGYVLFGRRQFFDVTTEAQTQWEALPGAVMRSTVSLARAGGCVVPTRFYNGGIGVFLNPAMFSASSRVCKTIDHSGIITDQEGLFKLRDYRSFWIGDSTGGYGVLGTPVECLVDGQDTAASGDAHVLTQKQAVNNEFYMGFNPIGVGQSQVVQTIKMVTDWRVKIP